MPETIAAFVSEPIVYRTASPGPTEERSILASYPTDEEDLLLSGYLRGGEALTRQAAAVDFGLGKGQVVMFGFGVQHRAQTEGTFKMLFNAIQQAGYETAGEKAVAGK